MKKIMLDFSEAENREQMHTLLEEAFGFPAWYGRNLDALYDCLTDIMEDTCAGFYGMPDGEEEGYLQRIRRTCEEAEEENRHLCFFFFP